MEKSSNKSKSKKPTKDKFTVTEVGTLIEQLRSEFRVFGESQKAIIEKLDTTYEQVVRNTEDIALLKMAVKDLTAKIKELTDKVEKNTKAITALTQSIDNLVKTKTDREELLALEKRISILEGKITLLSQ